MGTPKGDLRDAKKAVDTFTRERADERATLERVRGTERLYGLVVRFNAACSEGMTPEHYAKFPGYAPMVAELAAAGFRDLPDYERAMASYYLLFERRARDIGLLALDNSKQVVNSEIDRYSDPRGLAAVFDDLEPIRDMLDANGAAGRGSRAPRPSARRREGRTTATGGTVSDPGRSRPGRLRARRRHARGARGRCCSHATGPSWSTSTSSARRSSAIPMPPCCSSTECGN